jgi:uncharacterized zinc-type alcohol dehydrogenase-like protein
VTRAYAAQSPTSGLGPWTLERRALRPDDVAIDILHCGVCHTDLHHAENDWGGTRYPVVPGHEIVGRVTAVGSEVTRYGPGDLVGVGCLVDSCRACDACEKGLEQYCLEGMVATYNGKDRHDGSTTYGGYSEHVVVSERFVLRIPDGMDPAEAAPIMCAGITSYSPLRHFGVQPGWKVGVVGMGGLGHMGIKLARALGAHVTLFTRSEGKLEEAKRNGAEAVVVTTAPGAFRRAAGTLDFILDTVPVEHDFNPYLECLKFDGIYVTVGQMTPVVPPLETRHLALKRRSFAGSLIGGLPETQELLDFCAEHGVRCDIERIRMDQINDAYARMKKGDVKYRFVIDMASLREG